AECAAAAAAMMLYRCGSPSSREEKRKVSCTSRNRPEREEKLLSTSPTDTVASARKPNVNTRPGSEEASSLAPHSSSALMTAKRFGLVDSANDWRKRRDLAAK